MPKIFMIDDVNVMLGDVFRDWPTEGVKTTSTPQDAERASVCRAERVTERDLGGARDFSGMTLLEIPATTHGTRRLLALHY